MKFTGRGFGEMYGSTMDGPVMWALGVAVGGKSAASVLGATELLTVAALAAGTAIPLASALGAAMACALLATPLLISALVPCASPYTAELYSLTITLLAAPGVLLSASLRYERTAPGGPLPCPSRGSLGGS
jgi:hypothetical protein